MRFTRLACSIALLALGAGCGSDDGGGGKYVPPAEPDIRQLSTAVCDAAFRCCSQGEVGWFLGPWIDPGSCSDRFIEHAWLSPGASVDLEPVLGFRLDVPNIAAVQSALAGGRVSIDADGLKACVDYLNAAPCAEPEPELEGCIVPDPPPPKTACDPRKIFKGLVKKDGTCTSALGSLECAAGLACAGDSELGVWGQCVPISRVGEPCVTSLECDEDLYCSPLDATCQAYRVEGETCMFADRDDPNPDPATALILCRSDLSCDPLTDTCVAHCQRGAKCGSDDDCDDKQELECIQGRCDLLRAEGLPCSSNSDCQKELICVADLVEPTKQVCKQRAPLGTVCATHSECASGFCDPKSFRCADPLPPGSLCPTGLDEQCAGGRCVVENLSCTSDIDCLGSKKCDLSTNQCASYCVALLPDGAACVQPSECDSGECVVGICRTLPLLNGQPCVFDVQCESEFCSLDPEPVCKDLPLPLGDPCVYDEQCQSKVCFQSSVTGPKICISGLDLNEECGKYGQPPCNPNKFFCDDEQEPKICVPLLETGEPCKSSVQCRGSCDLRFSRMLCSPAAEPNGAVCDGT